MKHAKIGDVVEVPVSGGFAYALHTHRHKQYGGLLRVFGEVYPTGTPSFDWMDERPPAFSCFFPLGVAVNRNIVKIVENRQVPYGLVPFPLFRSGTPDRATKKVESWWFWDGEREWQVGEISEAGRAMPIRGVWNDTLLIERIQSGWTPQTDRM